MKATVIKYIIFITLTVTFSFCLKDIVLTAAKVDSIINLIVSVTSITLAILVTFFISKLFSEREDRIHRKATIDEYSKKVTSLRRIAHRIKRDRSFWRFASITKVKLDSKYPHLTVEQFRSLKWKQYDKLTEELEGELAPQAYMALRGLENNEQSDFEFYKSFKPQNYSLDEIARFIDYCRYFWAYCEEYKNNLTFNHSSSDHLHQIQDEYVKIKGHQIDRGNFFKEIVNLFSEFQEKIFPEMYFLTELNERKLPHHFVWVIINLVIYIAIMITAIVLFIQPICLWTKTIILMTLTSLLIVNTIDLIIGLFMSIPRELKINEFYRL